MNSRQTHVKYIPILTAVTIVLLFVYAMTPSYVFGTQPTANLDVRELMSDRELQQTGMSSLSKQEMTAFNNWLTAFAQKARRGEVASPAAQYSSTAAYEDVLAFPDRYAGRTVRFENVQIDGSISRTSAADIGSGFILTLKTPRGTRSSTVPLPSTLPLVLDDPMAEQFLGLNLNASSLYSANVDAQVRKGVRGQYWFANVIRLELLSRGGNAVHTITRD